MKKEAIHPSKHNIIGSSKDLVGGNCLISYFKKILVHQEFIKKLKHKLGGLGQVTLLL